MSDRTTRTVELDLGTAQWLAQLDEDTDDLVNDLLREYRNNQ